MKRNSFTIFTTLILLVGASLWWAAPSYGDNDDHKRAREALLAGEVLPLRTVLNRVEQTYAGQVLKIEFEEEDGVYLYKIKLLRNSGDLIKLKVGATDGRILAVKGRSIRPEGGH